MIPAVAHFIWFGARFPWVNRLALRSAALRGGFERVVLHHDGELDAGALEGLDALPGFEARRIVTAELFAAALGVDGPRLARVFEDLGKPNARADLVRAAILAGQGGVYLDLDTVTVRSLRPLLTDGAFCGEEHVAWPAHVKRSRRVDVLATAYAQDALRAVCAAVPGGWRLFRRVQGWYPRAVNNAVLGARPGHPFVVRLLEAMLELPESRRRVPYALGTHLLQSELSAWPPGQDPVRVHAPPVFYPLGPVVSLHWFGRGGARVAEAVVRPETRVVHWYASVRTQHLVPRIDPAWVKANAETEPFSALARPFVEG